jgi:hypothetical protein
LESLVIGAVVETTVAGGAVPTEDVVLATDEGFKIAPGLPVELNVGTLDA